MLFLVQTSAKLSKRHLPRMYFYIVCYVHFSPFFGKWNTFGYFRAILDILDLNSPWISKLYLTFSVYMSWYTQFQTGVGALKSSNFPENFPSAAQQQRSTAWSFHLMANWPRSYKNPSQTFLQSLKQQKVQ